MLFNLIFIYLEVMPVHRLDSSIPTNYAAILKEIEGKADNYSLICRRQQLLLYLY